MKKSAYAATEPFRFFAEIAENNNRPWFMENKERYMELREQWILGMTRVTAALSKDWPELTYSDPRRNTYRIYRDIRFSNDKTPYKTHIGTTLTPPAMRGTHVGMYMESGNRPDMTGLYGGIWSPDAVQLRKLRKAIADNSEEWLEIVEDPALVAVYGKEWYGESLKTAPKGYSPNHPMIEYLRMKGWGKYHSLEPEFFNDPDWPERAADMLRPLVPLLRFLTYSLTEEI